MAEDYWGNGYWGDGYWASGYWGQGGTTPPPAPSVTIGNAWIKRKRRKLSLDELTAITLLITNLSREENG